MSLLGKLAGGIVRAVTHGAIRPNFSRPNLGRGRQLVSGRSNVSLLGFGEQGFGTGAEGDVGQVPGGPIPGGARGRGFMAGNVPPPRRGHPRKTTALFTPGGGTAPYAHKN